MRRARPRKAHWTLRKRTRARAGHADHGPPRSPAASTSSLGSNPRVPLTRNTRPRDCALLPRPPAPVTNEARRPRAARAPGRRPRGRPGAAGGQGARSGEPGPLPTAGRRASARLRADDCPGAQARGQAEAGAARTARVTCSPLGPAARGPPAWSRGRRRAHAAGQGLRPGKAGTHHVDFGNHVYAGDVDVHPHADRGTCGKCTHDTAVSQARARAAAAPGPASRRGGAQAEPSPSGRSRRQRPPPPPRPRLPSGGRAACGGAQPTHSKSGLRRMSCLSAACPPASFTKDMFPGSLTLREGVEGEREPGQAAARPPVPPGGHPRTVPAARPASRQASHDPTSSARSTPPPPTPGPRRCRKPSSRKPHIPPPRPGTGRGRPAAVATRSRGRPAAAAAAAAPPPPRWPRAEEGAGGGLGRRARREERGRGRAARAGAGRAGRPQRAQPGPRQRPAGPPVPAARRPAGCGAWTRGLRRRPRAGCSSRPRRRRASRGPALKLRWAWHPRRRDGRRRRRGRTAKETLSTPPETSPSACSSAWPLAATVRRRCRPSPRQAAERLCPQTCAAARRQDAGPEEAPCLTCGAPSLASPGSRRARWAAAWPEPRAMAVPLTRHGWDPLSPAVTEHLTAIRGIPPRPVPRFPLD